MKKEYLIILLLVLCMYILFQPRKEYSTTFFQIDSCLDRGYCWDYYRNRSEENDQGYCVRNSQECKERLGIWDNSSKYCKI